MLTIKTSTFYEFGDGFGDAYAKPACVAITLIFTAQESLSAVKSALLRN